MVKQNDAVFQITKFYSLFLFLIVFNSIMGFHSINIIILSVIPNYTIDENIFQIVRQFDGITRMLSNLIYQPVESIQEKIGEWFSIEFVVHPHWISMYYLQAIFLYTYSTLLGSSVFGSSQQFYALTIPALISVSLALFPLDAGWLVQGLVSNAIFLSLIFVVGPRYVFLGGNSNNLRYYGLFFFTLSAALSFLSLIEYGSGILVFLAAMIFYSQYLGSRSRAKNIIRQICIYIALNIHYLIFFVVIVVDFYIKFASEN